MPRKTQAQLFLDTLELRKGSVITPTEVNRIKRRWNPWRALKNGIVVYDEYERFMEAGPFQVTKEAQQVGINWWMSTVFRKDGEPRVTEFVRQLPISTDRIKRVLENVEQFLLIDWEFESNQVGTLEWPFPVYQVSSSTDGFSYVQRPWISGCNYVYL